ncbi:MAG: zinc metallopeptidase [Ruminococcaceae bacterium]|nr:zinc metallopeptidase [Oscillospiraceae bacterium]
MFFYSFDSIWTYVVIVLPAVILAMWASANVNSTYKKYSKVISKSGYTANDVVRNILDAYGLHHVRIEHVSGDLTDHYDPKANVIRLSDTTDGSRSAAAIGVAAHEAGHAVQHAVGYGPIKLRMVIIPVCNIGSTLSMPLILLGIVLSYPPLCYLGILAFATATFFQLVTLPVEFNASKRALAILENAGMPDEDVNASKKVLTAAALTYVAALAVSLANLLRLILIVNGRSRD